MKRNTEQDIDETMTVPKSSTATLIAAMRELAATVHCEDGVANAAIAEAADRLQELEVLRMQMANCIDDFYSSVSRRMLPPPVVSVYAERLLEKNRGLDEPA